MVEEEPERMMDCTAATEFTRLEKIPSKKYSISIKGTGEVVRTLCWTKNFFYRFGGIMPIYLIVIIFTIIHTVQSYMHSSFIIRRGPSSCILIVSSLSLRRTSMGPRIELGPALQQADAIPTEQRRTLQLSFVASPAELRRTPN